MSFFAGILKEGKIINQEFDAQRMADLLSNCISDKKPHMSEDEYRLCDKSKQVEENWKRGKIKREIQACVARLTQPNRFFSN